MAAAVLFALAAGVRYEAWIFCAVFGAVVVMLVASLECAEVVKIVTGSGAPLRNRLLLVDLSDLTFEVMRLT